MDTLWRILPTVAFVVYSQIVMKWRLGYLQDNPDWIATGSSRYLRSLADPFILSAYVASLIGSLFWIYTLSKVPLAQAFPLYQGITFLVVMIGAALLLGEQLDAPKTISALLILAGVIIGTQG